MMDNYFKADMIVFAKADLNRKREMIEDALDDTDREYYYSRQCLLAMIAWQADLIDELTEGE